MSPWKLPTPCSVPGCPNTKPCPVHAKPRTWNRDKRESPAKRGYDSGWKKQRIAALKRDDFVCQRCGRRAQVVHHVIPLPQGTHDIGNLLSLCRICHEATHGRKKG